MNIVTFFADGYTEFNSSNFRCVVPSTALQKSGKAQTRLAHIQHWLKQTKYGKYLCAWADIIVLQRVLIEESINHAKYWTAKNKAVVIDFDDDYRRIRADNAAFFLLGRGWRRDSAIRWN